MLLNMVKYVSLRSMRAREQSMITTMCTEQEGDFFSILELPISTINYTDLELIGELAMGYSSD